ncbi:unnamed protein product, partial [Prorocentrum cordatum]
ASFQDVDAKPRKIMFVPLSVLLQTSSSASGKARPAASSSPPPEKLQEAQKKIKDLEKNVHDSEKAHQTQEAKRKKEFEVAKKKLGKDVKEKESEVKKVEKQVQKVSQMILKIEKTQDAAKEKIRQMARKVEENIDKAELDKRGMQRQLTQHQGSLLECRATLAYLKKAYAKLSEGVILDGLASEKSGTNAFINSVSEQAPGSPPISPSEQAPGSPVLELDGDGDVKTEAQKVCIVDSTDDDEDDADDDDDVDELTFHSVRALRQSVRELEAFDQGLSDADEAARPSSPPSPPPTGDDRAGALGVGRLQAAALHATAAGRRRGATAETMLEELRARLEESERARGALEAALGAGAQPEQREALGLSRKLLELEATCAQSPGARAQRAQQAAIRLGAVLDTVGASASDGRAVDRRSQFAGSVGCGLTALSEVGAPEPQRRALAALCEQLLRPAAAGGLSLEEGEALLERAEREAPLPAQPAGTAAQRRPSADAEELRRSAADAEELRVELEGARLARAQALAEAEASAEGLRDALRQRSDELELSTRGIRGARRGPRRGDALRQRSAELELSTAGLLRRRRRDLDGAAPRGAERRLAAGKRSEEQLRGASMAGRGAEGATGAGRTMAALPAPWRGWSSAVRQRGGSRGRPPTPDGAAEGVPRARRRAASAAGLGDVEPGVLHAGGAEELRGVAAAARAGLRQVIGSPEAIRFDASFASTIGSTGPTARFAAVSRLPAPEVPGGLPGRVVRATGSRCAVREAEGGSSLGLRVLLGRASISALQDDELWIGLVPSGSCRPDRVLGRRALTPDACGLRGAEVSLRVPALRRRQLEAGAEMSYEVWLVRKSACSYTEDVALVRAGSIRVCRNVPVRDQLTEDQDAPDAVPGLPAPAAAHGAAAGVRPRDAGAPG